MLSWAITFLVIALIAGVLGFGGIAGASAGIAKILFVIFLIAFIASLVLVVLAWSHNFADVLHDDKQRENDLSRTGVNRKELPSCNDGYDGDVELDASAKDS